MTASRMFEEATRKSHSRVWKADFLSQGRGDQRCSNEDDGPRSGRPEHGLHRLRISRRPARPLPRSLDACDI
ncbi:hypothetical protein Y032_0547g3274 [Ancylostoma ceylanicum]|nr:hypothetical protein Y032_0547g3274 [Ancylostoma ceylanicum]